MPKENNKMQVDIENLFKQNVNDLLSIKELYRRIEEIGEKITQIKYIDNTLVKKLKKEYENLKKIILDENIQVKLTNDIETINSHLETIVNDNMGSVSINKFLINDNNYDINSAIEYCSINRKKLLIDRDIIITKPIIIKNNQLINIQSYGEARNTKHTITYNNTNGEPLFMGENEEIKSTFISIKGVSFKNKSYLNKNSFFKFVGMAGGEISDCNIEDFYNIFDECSIAVVTKIEGNNFGGIYNCIFNNTSITDAFIRHNYFSGRVTSENGKFSFPSIVNISSNKSINITVFTDNWFEFFKHGIRNINHTKIHNNIFDYCYKPIYVSTQSQITNNFFHHCDKNNISPRGNSYNLTLEDEMKNDMKWSTIIVEGSNNQIFDNFYNVDLSNTTTQYFIEIKGDNNKQIANIKCKNNYYYNPNSSFIGNERIYLVTANLDTGIDSGKKQFLNCDFDILDFDRIPEPDEYFNIDGFKLKYKNKLLFGGRYNNDRPNIHRWQLFDIKGNPYCYTTDNLIPPYTSSDWIGGVSGATKTVVSDWNIKLFHKSTSWSAISCTINNIKSNHWYRFATLNLPTELIGNQKVQVKCYNDATQTQQIMTWVYPNGEIFFKTPTGTNKIIITLENNYNGTDTFNWKEMCLSEFNTSTFNNIVNGLNSTNDKNCRWIQIYDGVNQKYKPFI